jgi:hypothetical protein
MNEDDLVQDAPPQPREITLQDEETQALLDQQHTFGAINELRNQLAADQVMFRLAQDGLEPKADEGAPDGNQAYKIRERIKRTRERIDALKGYLEDIGPTGYPMPSSLTVVRETKKIAVPEPVISSSDITGA